MSDQTNHDSKHIHARLTNGTSWKSVTMTFNEASLIANTLVRERLASEYVICGLDCE